MRERHKLPRLPLPHFQYKYVSGHHSNTTGRTPKSSMICVVTSVARSYPHLTTSPLFWKYALISRRICREGGREGEGREGGREGGGRGREGGREGGGRGRERGEGGRRKSDHGKHVARHTNTDIITQATAIVLSFLSAATHVHVHRP